jgi:thiol-disulfide isomerase/thioredoxin
MSYTEKSNTLIYIIVVLLIVYWHLCKKFNSSIYELFIGTTRHVYYFYSDSCPHCISMKPIYKQVQNELKSSNGVNFMYHSIDMNDDNNQALITKHNVTGMPHLIMTDDNENVSEFKNERTVNNIKTWLIEK